MQLHNDLDVWLSIGGFHRKPEFFEAIQARDHEGLNKLAEFRHRFIYPKMGERSVYKFHNKWLTDEHG